MNYYFGRGLSRWTPFFLLLPGFFLYLILSVGPSLATSIYSFTDATGVAGAPVHWIGLENYHEFLLLGAAARENYEALLRTLAFSFFVSVIQFLLGLLVAVVLNQRLKGTTFFRALFFMPVILGVAIQGLIWSLFLYPLGGPVERVVELFGAHSEFLGGQPVEAFAWVIVVQIWANLGITMVVFLAGLQTIPEELVEAAQMDGANSWQAFWSITWPLLTPSVNTNILLNILGSLQAWALFLVLTGGKPGTQVLGWIIYAEAFARQTNSLTGTSMRQGYGAAASMVLFIMVLTIGLTTNYILRRREERLLG